MEVIWIISLKDNYERKLRVVTKHVFCIPPHRGVYGIPYQLSWASVL